MLNCAILMGRITKEPELRQTTSQISVISFTIAVDRAYTPKGQDKQTDFIDIVAWRQQAEFVNRFFHKGDMIAVQGEIQIREYDAKDGTKRKAFEIVADKVSFCGSKSDNQADSSEQKAANLDRLREKLNVAVEDDTEDLPF